MSHGLDDDAFWRKSPRQIVAILRGREAALIRAHNERAWLAWYTAYLPRMKKPVKLERLQVRQGRPPRPPQTWQQMKAMAQLITAAFGGEVIPKTDAAASKDHP